MSAPFNPWCHACGTSSSQHKTETHAVRIETSTGTKETLHVCTPCFRTGFFIAFPEGTREIIASKK